MSRRPTRAETGRLVNTSADRLGDSLLLDEDTARLAMEAKFTEEIRAAQTAVSLAFRSGLTSSILSEPFASLNRRIAETVVACVPDLRALLVNAADQTLRACRYELEAIERNLGRRYDGLGSQAVDVVGATVDVRYEERVATWLAEVAVALLQFEDMVADDWRTAERLEESEEQVLRRMFSPDGANLPGHAGMGAWWKPLSACFASARSQEFILVNGIRVDAIRIFNEEGAALRDG